MEKSFSVRPDGDLRGSWDRVVFCDGSRAARRRHGLESWLAGLNELSLHGAQAGVDYIFTFGPLNYLETATIIPELFWQRYVWELVLKAFSAVVLVLLAREMRPRFAGYIFLALTITIWPTFTEDSYILSVVALGLLLRQESRWQVAGLMVAPPFFAVLALMKFTNFPMACATLGTLAALSWYEGRRWKAVVPLTLFVVSFLIGWVLLGQRLENIPAFFHSMSEIVRGYSEAMAQAGSHIELYLGIAILLLFGAAVATFGFADIVRPHNLAGLLIIALAVFKSFKHGFVRQDLHVLHFFETVALLAFAVLVVAKSERRQVLRQALLGSAVLLSLIGFYVATSVAPFMRPAPEMLAKRFQSHFDAVFSPASVYAESLQAQERESKILDLPKIRASEGQNDRSDLVRTRGPVCQRLELVSASRFSKLYRLHSRVDRDQRSAFSWCQCPELRYVASDAN